MGTMNPNIPQAPLEPGPAPDPHDPYAFIMNAGQPAPKSKLPLSLPKGNSTFQRVLIGAGGFFVLLIIGLIVLSLFSGNGNNDKLLTLAQEQTEIIRVADLARNERTIRDSTTKNLASSASLSVGSSRQKVLSLLSGKKVNDKTLSLKKSAKTDTELTTAATNNQYDEVFTQILTDELKTYQTNVKQLYTNSKNTEEKAILEEAYNGTVILLGQQTQ